MGVIFLLGQRWCPLEAATKEDLSGESIGKPEVIRPPSIFGGSRSGKKVSCPLMGRLAQSEFWRNKAWGLPTAHLTVLL